MKKILSFFKKHDIAVLIISTIIYEIIAFFIKKYYILNIFSSFYFLIILALLFDKKNKHKTIFYIIYILGIYLRTRYIINTSIVDRQHDVSGITDDGHLGYIYTIFKTYDLPKVTGTQFYHPPFWHIISAIFLRFITIFVHDINSAAEGIQILSLLFSQFIIIIVDNICKKLKISDKYRLLTDLFFAVHPTMLILSGSINNDCLLTFFEFLVILVLINWHKDPSLKNTIILAICTGLCVMSKANGAVMAIPILYIFISKFIHYIKKKDKKAIIHFLKEMLIFVLISIPLGLWYQASEIVVFGEIQKIPAPSMTESPFSLKERFFTLDFYELGTYINVTSNHNLPAFLIKSSIFGEYVYPISNTIKVIITILALNLVILSLFFTIKYIFTKKKIKEMNLILLTGIVYLIAMYFFNYYYPYNCTMDFRYVVITLLPIITIITYETDRLKEKYLKIPSTILIIIFIIMSVIVMHSI